MIVLIPAAGVGSRLKPYTNYYNKALLPIGRVPVISHIIENYPKNTDFIIATGYGADHIKEYLKYAYPNKRFYYVNVDPFEGKGSGLQTTLQQSLKHIKSDFIFHVNDAILKEKFKLNFTKDTLFISKKYRDTNDFRKVSLKKNKVLRIYNKNITSNEEKLYTYIGVAYVKDYKLFKEIINQNHNQLAELNYFSNICKSNKLNFKLSNRWYDSGNPSTLNDTLKALSNFKNLNKLNEAIYFKSKKVIKFSTDANVNQKKIIRAKILGNNVPKLTNKSKHFYSYNYISGRLFSQIEPNINEFKNLLKWLEANLWFKKNKNKPMNFRQSCKNFYYFKTINRVKKFYSIYRIKDKTDIINGYRYPSLKKLFSRINWELIFKGTPVMFHGDLHFENIIKKKKNYKLIDWRDSFDKNIYFGDIYYDLAKILHGLIVNHSIIKKEKFEINIKGNKINYKIKQKSGYKALINYYKKYLLKKNFSIYKVNLITSLIFLNISPLHSGKYGIFLYYLGKKILGDIVKVQFTKKS